MLENEDVKRKRRRRQWYTKNNGKNCTWLAAAAADGVTNNILDITVLRCCGFFQQTFLDNYAGQTSQTAEHCYLLH